MRLLRYGIKYSLAPCINPPIYVDSSGRSLHLNFESDFPETRLVHFIERAREYLENRCSGLCILTAQYTQQSFALSFTCSLVDYDLRLTMPEVNRAWPRQHTHNVQAIELRIAMMALLDLQCNDSMAVSVRWQRIELTWTSVGAVTVREFPCFDHPFGHVALPPQSHHHVVRRQDHAVPADYIRDLRQAK
jgi:hypothetical protein